MARRGEALREHILWSAKTVFLELGFERASMDLVAARAATSKRSVYAHFENKEALFFAVVELVRTLFLHRLGHLGDDGETVHEALVTFCTRYIGALTYENTVRMIRVCAAEADRFPGGAAQFFGVVFTDVQDRLGAYLSTRLGLTSEDAAAAAEGLLAEVLHPRFTRALFGIDPLHSQEQPTAPVGAPGREAARRAVDTLLTRFSPPVNR